MRYQGSPSVLALATAVAVAVVAAAAFAAPRDRFPIDLNDLRAETEQRFDAVDADGNGQIAVDEFVDADSRLMSERAGWRGDSARDWAGAGREGVFSAADADADGQLSEQEFNAVPIAARRVRQQRLFERLDANADGGLSLDEFASRLTRLQALDANADGFVSRDEMPRNMRAHRGGRGQRQHR